MRPGPGNPSGAGSLGSWLAAAVTRFGSLFEDEPGVPRYSGRVAVSWGDARPDNDLDRFVGTGKKYLVRSVARIKTWEQYVAAIASGYGVTVASNVGYQMQPDRQGFHRRGPKPWPHQLSAIGVHDKRAGAFAVLHNQWGNVHGSLFDFEDNHSLPEGCLRVTAEDFMTMVTTGECYAWSDMLGFVDREAEVDAAIFDIIGTRD